MLVHSLATMGSSAVPGGRSRTESTARVSFRPSEPLFDIHIDTQYAKVNCQPIEYGGEPWNYYRDAPNTYLSIREGKREEFLRRVPEPVRERVQHEIQRIERTRKNFSSYPNKQALMKELYDSRKAWETSVIENLRDFRAAADKKCKCKANMNPESVKHTRECELLRRLESWRSRHSQELAPPKRTESTMSKLKGSMTFRRRASQVQPHVHVSEDAPLDDGPKSTTSTIKDDDQMTQDPLYGFRASAIYFKKNGDQWTGQTHKHDKFIGKDKFPNQKISVHDLLESSGKDSPLFRGNCPDKTIRYFHFPTNNMSWIERAIARYYGEELPTIDERIPYNKTKSKTEKLLAREYWRGQMHGSGDKDRATLVQQDQGREVPGSTSMPKAKARVVPVHARHMRSKCSLIPRETSSNSRPERNVTLFMPYLHWETSSRRAKMVQVVNEAMESQDLSKSQTRKPTLPTAADVVAKLSNKSEYKPTYRNLLGRYLMTIARVADEIDFEADERLLRDNVSRTPPLHIRRTIDQYYFPTLEDTSLRDKDQVVYRGTRAGRSFHTKNTRVVMVDQLWLWILDDHTIITSFPRRWGRNKPDPSGVHKSLRERLEAMSGGIKSIHHLALMIIDQTSNVFFDRTKPLDQRPEVMDLFSSAIGHVTELTSVAYEGFWRNTALQARNFINMGADNIKHKYLEINPEGQLLQEAQDITEELQIMKRIFNEQIQVVRDFRRHLDHLADAQRSKDDSKDMATLLSKILDTMLQEKQNKTNGEGSEGGHAATFHQASTEAVALSGANQDVHEADVLLELIEGRKAEIQDKEDLAHYACQHIEGLLSLKQQQASIVQAKSALRRADESVKQGRSIMAFTVVTIFFLPLGFFATFFGMNNMEINEAAWMTLSEQINYMFGFSAIVIVLSVSMAFSAWSRAVLNFLFWVPLAVLAESTGLRAWWKKSPLNRVKLERRAVKVVEHASYRRRVGNGEETTTTTTYATNISEPLKSHRRRTGDNLV
ncbi:hypothetical protein V8F06_002758 [Rhypophila decipiens]